MSWYRAVVQKLQRAGIFSQGVLHVRLRAER